MRLMNIFGFGQARDKPVRNYSNVSIHSISDDGNKEAVKEAVNEFVLRIMDDCETMGYSEERRA